MKETLLTIDQRNLIIILVEADKNIDKREPFFVQMAIGTPTTIHHPGLEGEKIEVYMGDIEILAHKGLILGKPGRYQSIVKFDITPEGFSLYENIINKETLKKEVQMSSNPKKVFIVHGRDERLRDAIFQFLRSIGLTPIEWSQAVGMTGKAAPYVGEILQKAFSQAQAVVVLLTGDDIAKLRDDLVKDADSEYEKNFTVQARPNVLFEAGLAFGTHPERTILIEFGMLRPFSDIGGRHVIRMNNSTQKRQELAQRLINAGCLVDMSGTDWHGIGNFNNVEKLSILEDIKKEEDLRNKEELTRVEVDILIAFAKSEDYTSLPLSETEIKIKTGLSMTAIRYHLHSLAEREYLYFDERDGGYFLALKGRGFLVGKSLI